MIPTVAQWEIIALINQVIASNPKFAWIKPSYICATVSVESGWDTSAQGVRAVWVPSALGPPILVQTGNSLGLMQVQAATAVDVVAAYGLTDVGPQTDPHSSLLVGTCYFDMCARKIIAARGVKSLYLTEVAEAYNAGYAGFLAGHGDPRYGAKMLAQQIAWAPLVDSVVPPVVPVDPPSTAADVVFDISHYENQSIDFAAAAQGGMVAVILKATQGTDFVDPTFLSRAAAAGAAGLEVGAYHFLDGSDPAAQVAHFLTVAVSEAGVNWLALDWEPYPPSQASVIQAATAAAGIKAATGRWPVLYTIHTMLSAPNQTLSNCPLWLAEWGNNPVCPPGFTSWKLWQHTNGQFGSNVVPVPGIGLCDRSKFAGTVDELKAWWAAPTLSRGAIWT